MAHRCLVIKTLDFFANFLGILTVRIRLSIPMGDLDLLLVIADVTKKKEQTVERENVSIR
ncbi:hypothetical protein SADUNF_Sadunf10G0160400 [Salix dunnii]|uniref:Uncharacterized protein n=1 Tax=Salix dunnii TaxID=1413687 RepID=A0A835JP28_9ROSI|nr:hypothetical protein SADUNF_Sadunf10G0160400 [Salix dunnii]